MRIDIDNNWLIVKYNDDDTREIIRMDTVIAVEKGPETDYRLNIPQITIVTTQKTYSVGIANGDVEGHERWESRDIIFDRVKDAILQYSKDNKKEEE